MDNDTIGNGAGTASGSCTLLARCIAYGAAMTSPKWFKFETWGFGEDGTLCPNYSTPDCRGRG